MLQAMCFHSELAIDKVCVNDGIFIQAVGMGQEYCGHFTSHFTASLFHNGSVLDYVSYSFGRNYARNVQSKY